MLAITDIKEMDAQELLVRVLITQVKGSAPREQGTCMWVALNSFWGTIGGGHLEWQLLAEARDVLKQALAMQLRKGLVSSELIHHFPSQKKIMILGAQLGQCCGGRVEIQMDLLTAYDALQHSLELQKNWQDVTIFGAGHVALALARQLLLLQFQIYCKDSRDPTDWQLDPDLQLNFTDRLYYEQVQPIEDAVADIPAQSQVLILTHNHAEDFAILKACLLRQKKQADLASIGLIGSASKWASFHSRLLSMGFTQAEIQWVKCPIGISSIKGKEPAVIALSVAADWLSNKS